MLRWLCSGLAISFLGLAASPAKAQFFTGNDIFAECQASPSDTTYWQRDMKCTAYIVGAYDAADAVRSARNTERCGPDGLTAGQLRDVVVKYMRDNPETRNLSGGKLVILAIMTAWQCGSK